jgi:hypothetical protein
MAELGMAQAMGKRIIPVLAPGARLDESVSDLLPNYLILDMGQLSVEEASARIVEAIKSIPVDAARRLLPSTRRRRNIVWAAIIAALLMSLIALYVTLAT